MHLLESRSAVTDDLGYRWWAGEADRCRGIWVEPGRLRQCEQDAGHGGAHFYRDWQWTDEFDKRDPWGNGKRRKVDAL